MEYKTKKNEPPISQEGERATNRALFTKGIEKKINHKMQELRM
jgi:hypothetical protein